jgi:hypothetical protein
MHRLLLFAGLAILALSVSPDPTPAHPFSWYGPPTVQRYYTPPDRPFYVAPAKPFFTPPDKPFYVPPAKPFYTPPDKPFYVPPAGSFYSPHH